MHLSLSCPVRAPASREKLLAARTSGVSSDHDRPRGPASGNGSYLTSGRGNG
jgi:hypothetical protein